MADNKKLLWITFTPRGLLCSYFVIGNSFTVDLLKMNRIYIAIETIVIIVFHLAITIKPLFLLENKFILEIVLVWIIGMYMGWNLFNFRTVFIRYL